jgi:peptide deformylase
MKEIIQIGDPRLKEMSDEITDTNSSEIKELLSDLDDALATQDDGVAISSPQIGVNLRVFVVSGKVFDEEYMEGDKKEVDESIPNMYVINPKITKTSKDMMMGEEGCLSIRGIYGDVERHKNVTIEALDEKGVKFTRGAGGLLSRIFQHEIDHLDGILFTEKAINLREEDDYKGKERYKNEGI